MREFTEKQYLSHVDKYKGICKACNSLASNVEGDARGYECKKCKRATVYGMEEALLMGIIGIK